MRTTCPRAIPQTVRAVLAEKPAQASVYGWIRSVRAHKNVAFAEVDDGSGVRVQAVLKGGKADGLTLGSAVKLTGSLQPSRGAGQALELQVAEVDILGASSDAYPIQKKALPAPVLREYAHLRFRTSQTAAVMRVRDGLARDWHDWFETQEFTHIHTPIMTSADCEGAGEVFTVAQSLPSPQTASDAASSSTETSPSPAASSSSPPPFFPRPVSLTVSSQLHLEAPTHALSRTYTLSPAFRAEPSQTSRHLAEFYMLEAEVAFTTSLSSLCDLVEASIRETLNTLLTSPAPRATRMREDIARIAASLAAETEVPAPDDPLAHLRAASAPFARVTYAQALDLLNARHAETPFTIPPGWDGLASEHEKWLAGEHFGRPTFVMHYPKAQKPFYMLPSEAADSSEEAARSAETTSQDGAGAAADSASAPPTVAAFDLLFPHIGELAGGSLREHRLAPLLSAIDAHGLPRDEYEWYLDLRRFGSAPHGGWGMGWERWVCFVTGVRNVRDVVAFPRWAGSCAF